jgi:hypothetical protein
MQEAREKRQMTKIVGVIAEQNPHSGEWEVGWKSDDGEFTPRFCGYSTKEEAEAEIPGFHERLDKEEAEWMRKNEENERREAERWPNLGHVRAEIKKLANRGKADKAFDAFQKLNWLLELDLAEHIDWPLPSWKAIKSGRVYGRY